MLKCSQARESTRRRRQINGRESSAQYVGTWELAILVVSNPASVWDLKLGSLAPPGRRTRREGPAEATKMILVAPEWTAGREYAGRPGRCGRVQGPNRKRSVAIAIEDAIYMVANAVQGGYKCVRYPKKGRQVL